MVRRLPERPTQILDRSHSVQFTYNGKAIDAYQGDSIASALLASGVETFSRSFKYHRRRSAACTTGQCARCTMNVDGRMHVKTCQTPAREGMIVESQDSVERDPKAMAEWFSRALPTGFYYKMFYEPRWFWKRVKEIIRAMPGNMAAVIPLAAKPHFDAVNLTADLLVIGGGLAGIEAAITASEKGASVILVESDPRLGGFEAYQGDAGFHRAQDSIRRLNECDNVKVLTSTTASAIYPDGVVICVESCGDKGSFVDRSYSIRPKATVIAVGVSATPMIFADNDRPGVFLPEAAQRLIHLWGVKPGARILVAGGDDYLARVALELAELGCDLAGFVDYRADEIDGDLKRRLTEKGVKIWNGYNVSGAGGARRVTDAQLASLDGSDRQVVQCDTIVASSGRYPRHKLLGQAGAKMRYDAGLNFYLPEALPPAFQAAGRLLGLEDPEQIKAQGRLAATRAINSLGRDADGSFNQGAAHDRGPAFSMAKVSPQPLASVEKAKKKIFICYCHDVSEKNIEQAIAEGFDNIETCKRYTTATQGACQGGMCEANFARILANIRPEHSARVLPTTRPPVSTISLGSMAVGHHDHPQLSPLHEVQLSQGGKPLRLGAWIRMEHFGDQEAESLAVHQAAGICDVSMLGKFRVFGPDAEKLLNRVLTKKVGKLTAGKILYHAQCNQAGILLDDGVTLKIGDHDFLVTTIAGRAPVTEEWFARWRRDEDWDVNVVNLTDAKAGINLAGPKSREILSKLTAADISNEAFPYLNWMHLDVAGVKAIVMRMGFVGELSYEIMCPSSEGPYLWNRLLEAGKPLGLTPFGIEALNICRLEKGHLVPGLDTDGFTTLYEASFGWMLNSKKTETVGKPMLDFHAKRAFRQQLIAFSVDGKSQLGDGALVVDGARDLGRVTSIRYSPLLGKTIGLALAEPHPEWREGGIVKLWQDGRETSANFAQPPFYDLTGERMKM